MKIINENNKKINTRYKVVDTEFSEYEPKKLEDFLLYLILCPAIIVFAYIAEYIWRITL